MTLNFKIPVMVGDEGSSKTTRIVVEPPKSGRKLKINSPLISNYSTVVKYSSNRCSVGQPKLFVFRLTVRLYSSNLWVSPYTPYQQKIYDLTCLKHEQEGLNFQQISDWLNNQNYLTPRGKTFTQSHVWSIYTKKKKSIERFSRMFTPIITDIGIQVG